MTAFSFANTFSSSLEELLSAAISFSLITFVFGGPPARAATATGTARAAVAAIAHAEPDGGAALLAAGSKGLTIRRIHVEVESDSRQIVSPGTSV